MALQLDHASVVVPDLDAAIAFFVALGMEVEGRGTVEGPWVDRINAVDAVTVDIAMLRTPDGQGKLEVTQFQSPAVRDPDPNAPPNTLGLRSIMFQVDDLDDAVARVQEHGGELIGTIEQYENVYRLCYTRGPGGAIVAFAQQLS